jgi:hypothetical protein
VRRQRRRGHDDHALLRITGRAEPTLEGEESGERRERGVDLIA